ncbi:rod shape-determining protein MreD [Meridianimarinicoccus roseus]|uniref:Rod shape-determining protein MreD n=1 Tax=Meridianimarinicoccus roseus TaxID=2072018 RepID=A0A2V2LAM7_9RHOB|nr:rod shape-determining protein MreD [Meridianimarinicoccus roseus]PWR02272.1 rod shape-determining protein MreD [Meridianimarinicoccus roseus]
MTDLRLSTRLAHWALFAGLAALVVLIKLLPLEQAAGGIPTPDLLLCLVLAWVVRRPDLLPVLLIAALFFLADMMLMRPPGLWAGLVVLATEWLRRRQRPLRAMPFPVECAMVGGVMTGLVLAHWGAQSLFFVQQPTLGQQLLRVPVTLAAYPPVVGLLHYGLGVRKRPAIEGFGAGVARS